MGDRHPIVECPPLSVERRVQLLEIHLAQLWDHVWWRHLPWYQRLWYRVQGFRDPLPCFYLDD